VRVRPRANDRRRQRRACCVSGMSRDPRLDHLTAALCFADCAKRAHNAAERAWFAQVARSEVTEAAGGSFGQARGEAEAGLTRPPSVRRGEGIAAGDISRVLRAGLAPADRYSSRRRIDRGERSGSGHGSSLSTDQACRGPVLKIIAQGR
jgi:hypothetical protein